MNAEYAGAEIVEMGIQIEINGRDFYTAVANNSQNAEIEKLFLYLADQEEKHIKVFSDLFYSISNHEPAESYPQEYFDYMNALASQHVFLKKDSGAQLAQKINDEDEAIDAGINVEKDSIIFYSAMKDVVPKNDKAILDRLIAEEHKHLQDLLEVKEKLRL